MSKGMSLENAVGRACHHYERAGRAKIRKQETGQTHGGSYRARAPIDWAGTVKGGRSIVIEAKMCALANFPLSDSHIKQRQVDALCEHHNLDAIALLVIEMTAYGEVYAVPFAELDRFLKAPWKANLSIAWLRAFGELVPVSGDGDKRAAWVLDAKPHPEREAAYLAVCEEKARAAGKTVELWPVEMKFRKRRTDDVKIGELSKEERDKRIAGAIGDFYDRALRNPRARGSRRGRR